MIDSRGDIDMTFRITFLQPKRLQYAEKAVARLLDHSVTFAESDSPAARRAEPCQPPTLDAFWADTAGEGLLRRFE
jgi:hypothetical protein